MLDKKRYVFTIGKVYIGSIYSFETVQVVASNEKSALNIATNYLLPNHLQTLTIINKTERKLYEN